MPSVFLKNRTIKRFIYILAILAVLLAAAAGFVRLRYGGGSTDFPNRAGPPEYPESALETVADLKAPPGNIAVSENGRVFFSL